MPGEKEINVNLFERLDLLDRIERVAKRENCEPVLQEIEFERKLIERKLYQKPPLADSEK
ncbi:hypothetical protein D7V86_02150 [bacterium D16-51]|nr:hypothetical protein D7V96_01575 [bacterium D16-59]RKI62342.1 hypothetical protein D7V86_02150 [bacterium D16-51]